MKKKIIPILVCLIMCVCGLSACGGDSFSKIKVSGNQNYDYVVHGNGGMAVQYGNYVYFVNGYDGYDDADGKQNTWPNVVKGGLYRVELSGHADGNEWVIEQTAGAVTDGMEFVSSVATDSDGVNSDVLNVQKIAPKRIGTNGYTQGGIFIYDQWVYFATPNNEKNKSGVVQTSKTDFFRAKLDGSDVQKIYTTATDAATEPYAFYKYNGAVYLVVKDGTDLVSVRVAKKPANKVTIAQNITNAYLPYSETYYSGMNENTLDHFVYVLREVGQEDTNRSGNVIEMMRPDGKEGGVVHSQEKSDTIEAVRDGLLFYRTTNPAGNDTLINYTSLHDFLMDEGNDISPSYRKYHSRLESYVDAGGNFKPEVTDAQKKEYLENARTQVTGTLLSASNANSYSSTHCFRPAGDLSDVVYMIGIKGDSVELRSNVNIESDRKVITIYDKSVTFLFVKGEYMYFLNSDSYLCRTRWDEKVTEGVDKGEVLSHAAVTATTFQADYCAGYAVYVSDLNYIADAYTFFRKIDGAEGLPEVFVGKVTDDDVLDAPSVSIKSGVLSWKEVDGAESYSVYYIHNGETKLAASGLTATSYTAGESDEGDYTYWVVAIAGDVVSARSNTVSYKA